ncbi:rap1 GTPase-GDP dissociation stimulator 1 [Lampetra fluviatilis]
MNVDVAVLRLLPSSSPPVQFKLLGTLRMLCDGQEAAARRLGSCSPLLRCAAEWAAARSHAGVAAEASRLLSASSGTATRTRK